MAMLECFSSLAALEIPNLSQSTVPRWCRMRCAVTPFPIVLADSSRMRLVTATRLYPRPACSNRKLVPLNAARIAS